MKFKSILPLMIFALPLTACLQGIRPDNPGGDVGGGDNPGGDSEGQDPLPPATALDLAKSIFWCFDYLNNPNTTYEENELNVEENSSGRYDADIWHQSNPDMYYFIQGYFGLEIKQDTVVNSNGIPTENEFYWDGLDYIIELFDSILPRDNFEDPNGICTPSRTYKIEADVLTHDTIVSGNSFPYSRLVYKVDNTLGVELLCYAYIDVGTSHLMNDKFYCAALQVSVGEYSVIAEN